MILALEFSFNHIRNTSGEEDRYGSKTAESLFEKGFAYHSGCYKNIFACEIFFKAKKPGGWRKWNLVEPKKIFTISKTIPFIDTSYIICQEDSISLHAIHSDVRDTQLKKAFDIAPQSLAMAKVRFEKARDAHAGDILYHTSCWEKHVTRCTSDFKSIVRVDRKQINQKVALRDIAVALKKGLVQGSIFHLKDIVDLYESMLEGIG